MDEKRYNDYQVSKLEKFEGMCTRCGECCGSKDGDPCINLEKRKDGTYYCKTYKNRLGIQRTVSGKLFNCTTIREIIKQGALRANCAYNNSYSIR